MKAVTIDNLDLKVHEQYARNQVTLDSSFIIDAQEISSHFELIGTSSIYSSKWEELFEIGIRNIPWALFSAPLSFKLQSNKYFRHKLFPSLDLEEALTEEKEEDSQEEESEENLELIKKILNARKGKYQTAQMFELEKSTLLNFFNSVKSLSRLLSQINARKLQYQKG